MARTPPPPKRRTPPPAVRRAEAPVHLMYERRIERGRPFVRTKCGEDGQAWGEGNVTGLRWSGFDSEVTCPRCRS